MLRVFVGENSFAINEKISELLMEADPEVRHVDGVDVRAGDLPELLAGTTLFASKRLVIINELSASKDAYSILVDWIDRVDDMTSVIIIESKPDKRLTTYKTLMKQGLVEEFPVWDESSRAVATTWTKNYAEQKGLTLTTDQAGQLAKRLEYNQWRIHHAVEKLAPLAAVTDEQLGEMIESSPHENVFELLAAALNADHEKVERTIGALKQSDDPYRVMGLLSSQILQLGALVLGEMSASDTARDIKQSPYALRGLERVSSSLSKQQVIRCIDECANVDYAMKSTGVEPWLLIKQMLLKFAQK